MAVKTAQYIFNGQAYNLTYNSTSGKWEATVTAPSKSSYNQPDHVLGGTVKATDAPAILPRWIRVMLLSAHHLNFA